MVGPTVADGAIVYAEIESVADLPAGWGDDQDRGRYRLVRRDDERLFDFHVGPTSWKQFTFPPVAPLTTVLAGDGPVRYEPAAPEIPKLAFLGVRACEIAALLVQDRVLLESTFTDDDYGSRRASALVIAMQCTSASPSCFCSSMGTGPEVRTGHDLAMTEVPDGFVAEAGSAAGWAILDRLPVRPATDDEVATVIGSVSGARLAMTNGVQTVGLPDRLLAHLDHPRWAQVAERCLTCANCTLVCPTCFCTSVAQRSDLVGQATGSERIWDSCFSPGFARVAGGGSFRSRPKDRYRQWLTHKFATWVDQFGTFGCVGCGRCITWCPVGIDVREEIRAIAPAVAPPVDRLSSIVVAGTPTEFASARVSSVRVETADVATLVLGDLDPALLGTLPGQFVMLTLPAFPRLPISVSRIRPDAIELTIRAAGPATTALTALREGDFVGIRGPLGVGWPIERAAGRDVVVVTGGIGLAPLRPLVDAVLADRDRFGAFRLYYGARTRNDFLYTDEIAAWSARNDMEAQLIVDRGDPSWLGRVGVVTQLFDQARWEGSKAVAFVCGPERMMQATVDALRDRGVHADRTYVTLERHMECGIGLCGHCQMGRHFVCKDGPVFSLAQLGDTFGREGI